MTVYSATKNGTKYLFLREATVGSWVIPVWGSVMNAETGIIQNDDDCHTFGTTNEVRVADIFYEKMYENSLNRHLGNLDTSKVLQGKTAAGTHLFTVAEIKNGLIYAEDGSVLSLDNNAEAPHFCVFACSEASGPDAITYENAVTI